jgi:hypothetical protein
MPSGAEIVEYLEWLESEYCDCSYVLLPVEAIVAFPWIRRFAWVSSGYVTEAESGNPATPKEAPRTGDRLFIVGRNLSIGNRELSFECASQKGKIKLDFAEADGIFRKDLLLVQGGAPVDELTPITVLDMDSPSDFIHAESCLAGGEEKYKKPLLFRF